MYEFPYEDSECYSCWCSGGVDSALLLYYLLKSNKHVIAHTTTSTSQVLYKNAIVSTNVIHKCIELTNNHNVTHINTYSKQKDEKDLKRNIYPFISNGMTDKIYTGITSNPSAGEIDMLSGQENKRDPNKIRSIKPNPWTITPFTNYDKKWIAERYKEEDLMDTLFPVTYSCEYYGPKRNDPGFSHCGYCWWCKERQWAFGRLD